MLVAGHFGDHYDSVRVDGIPLDPAESQAVWNHSPDGFSWGYGGSGPAQLALALLLVEMRGWPEGRNVDLAVRLHQDFKAEFVMGFPQSDFEVEIDVAGWIEKHRHSVKA